MDSEQTNDTDIAVQSAPVDPDAPATFTCVFEAAFEFTDNLELAEKLRQLLDALKMAGLDMSDVAEVAGRINGQVVRIPLTAKEAFII